MTVTTQTLTKKTSHMERQLHKIHRVITKTHYQRKHPKQEQTSRARWNALAGILKVKPGVDPVKWQKEARAQWER